MLPWLNDQVAKLILISLRCWPHRSDATPSQYKWVCKYFCLLCLLLGQRPLQWTLIGRQTVWQVVSLSALALLQLHSARQVTVTGHRSSPTHWQCHCYLNCSSFFNPPEDMSWLIRQLLSGDCSFSSCSCHCVIACKWPSSTESCQSVPRVRQLWA